MGDEDELTPCLSRIRPYHSVRYDAKRIRGWMAEIEEDLHTMEWMAAGGLGSASRESIIQSIDAQIGNLQSLREQVEELDDPREVGKRARELHTDGSPNSVLEER